MNPPADVPQAAGGGVRFIENRGQVVNTLGNPCPDILYAVPGKGMSVFFRRTGVSYVFTSVDGLKLPSRHDPEQSVRPFWPQPDTSATITTYRMDMDLVGANPAAIVTSDGEGTGHLNFYLAHCPNGITGVRSFDRIIYHDIYPNIDLVFYSNAKGLKYDFVVRPGGRPSDIRLRYTGADSLHALADGRVAVATPLGAVTEGTPSIYQADGHAHATVVRDTKAKVRGSYDIGDGTITFAVDSYDHTRTLVIDPSLVWCTYLGGSGLEYLWGAGWAWGGGGWWGWGAGVPVRFDPSGNVVYFSTTTSVDFPVTPGALQTTRVGIGNSYDVTISKLNPAGSMIWSTYYGGTGLDYSAGLAVDISGNVIVTGSAGSIDFPITPGTFCSVPAMGTVDGFLLKLDNNGLRQWCTFTQGGNGGSVAADRGGNIILVGQGAWMMRGTPGTFESNSPATGAYTGFVSRFNSAGARLWNTFIGGTSTGSASDAVTGVTVDSNSNILVAGAAFTRNFPVTPGASQTMLRGYEDAFVAKFDTTGNRVWSTLFGGAQNDNACGIVVDSKGNPTVAGNTTSSDLPTTQASFQASYSGGADVFVTKFDGATGAFVRTSYYGGSSTEYGGGVDIDAHNGVWMTGYTTSSNFPVTPDAFAATQRDVQNNPSGDCFIMKLDSTGTPVWSTYFGGSQSDYAEGIAANPLGCIVAGYTGSSNIPVSTGAFQTTLRGSFDNFLVKFCDPIAAITISRPTRFCQGDSTMLTAPIGFDNYHWSNGTFGRSITVTQSGTYSVTAGVGACTAISDPVTVIVSPLPRRTLGVSGAVNLCDGDSLVLGIGGGMQTYQWSNGATSPTITVRNTGRFSVFFIDSNGCSSHSDTVNVTLNARPKPAIAISGPLTLCQGDRLVLDAGAGFAAYRWSNGDTTAQTTITRSGSYNVRVMNVSGCWADAPNVSVKVNPAPKVKITPILPTVFCEGDSTVLAATPGFVSYSWSSGAFTPNVTLRKAGHYTLTAIDTNGCTAVAEVNILVTPRPAPKITPNGPTRFCNGDYVVLSASGGYSQYQWASGQQGQSIVARESGIYYLIATNDQGCSGISDTVRVQVMPKPAIAIAGPSSVCKNTLANYSVASGPGLTYRWQVSGGGGRLISGDGTNSASIQWGPSGTGTIMLSAWNDTTACSADTAFTVLVGSGLTPVVTTSRAPNICAGESVTLDAGAYSSYTWSNGATTRTVTISNPGTYTVSVADAQGCMGTSAPVRVSVNPTPAPAIAASNGGKLCAGGSVLLEATPGYVNYVWSNGALGEKIVVQGEGDYTVTVTDSAGCTGTSDPVEVKQLPVPVPAINGPATVCHNSSIAYTSPLFSGAAYTWNVTGGELLSGQGSSAVRVRWGYAGTGALDLTITTAEGCTGAAQPYAVTIGDRLEPVITPSGTVALCEGGAVTLDAGHGYASYLWSTGDTTPTLTLKDARLVSVTVTDSNGCTGTSAPADIVMKPVPAPVITPNGPAELCEGDSVVLQADSGYASYVWSNGSTKRGITVRKGGIYSVHVATADGCDGESPAVTVTVHPYPAKPAIIAKGDTLFAENGPAYQWNLDGSLIPGASAQWLKAPKNGSYTVTVTGEYGCRVTSEVYAFTIGLPVTPHVVWLDTISARVGDRVRLVMRVAPALVAADSITAYRAVLHVDPRALFVHGVLTPGASAAGDLVTGNPVTGDPAHLRYRVDGSVTIDRPANGVVLTGDELFRLDLEGLVTGQPLDLVTIDSVSFSGGASPAVAGDGLIVLSGCEIGSAFGKLVRIESIRPNPVASEAVISYQAPVGAELRLRLMDATGREQSAQNLPAGTGEVQEARLRMEGVASGLYMLELRNGGEHSILPIIIQK